MHGLLHNLGVRLARVAFVRRAIDDRADLSGFDGRPTAKVIVGVFLIPLSFIIGWPAIGGLGAASLYLGRPWIGVIGGPVLYGISHGVFLAGMALAGSKYSHIVLRWATRRGVEKLLACPRRSR